jgi:hypothetical protein
VANCFPHASHTMQMVHLGLLGTGPSSIVLRNVQQIKKLQSKKIQQSKKIDLQITNYENSA